MNAVTTIETGTDIILAVEETPQIVLLESEKFDQFYERVKAETEKMVIDVTTKRGRDAIIAMAAKVTKSKTAIDKARLQLTGAWREQTNQVNAAGKEIETRLATLAKEVRQPVTDWEVAEKERIDNCRADIDAFKRASVVTLDDTAATVRERGQEVWRQEIDPERFGDMLDEAVAAKDTAVATLKAALARLIREEEERAELERLRAEQAARQTREEEEREAAEVKARAESEAKDAEDRRIAAENAERERIERATKDAEERVRVEAEQKAREERDAERRQHEEAIAAERRRAEEAERAAQEERDRAAKEAADFKAAQDAAAAEQARRDADKAHRTKVKSAAKEAIMSCGADEETAKKIVLAIIAGEVPAVSLRF